ncbi:unnamed protein product [Anisakis simplex]|uniref:RecQ-mediated genome instability protein 1 n=1 Tax=Anisakis simplex TaxID=6269 RepID=A0A158PNE7_ANISI|nr:unnamed protein product [Anisakis simplex]
MNRKVCTICRGQFVVKRSDGKAITETKQIISSEHEYSDEEKENRKALVEYIPPSEKRRRRKGLIRLFKDDVYAEEVLKERGLGRASRKEKEKRIDDEEKFLKALSPDGPEYADAKKFLVSTRFVRVREELTKKLFDIYRRRCFDEKDSLDHESLAEAVYEQWIHFDIKYSTEPMLPLSSTPSARKKVIHNISVVLQNFQINSLVDIGTSFHYQIAELTDEFEDNSGFTTANDDQKNNSEAISWATMSIMLIFIFDFPSSDYRFLSLKKPRRMLLLELTDGQTNLKAIEYRPIKDLSLLTCPGCKILVYGAIEMRRNILFLTESNSMVLGGHDETLMKTNRPVEVMARALGKDITNKVASVGKQTTKSQDRKAVPSRLNSPETPKTNATSSASSLLPRPVMEVKPLADKHSRSDDRTKSSNDSPLSSSVCASFRFDPVTTPLTAQHSSSRTSKNLPSTFQRKIPVTSTPLEQHSYTKHSAGSSSSPYEFHSKRIKIEEENDDDIMVIDVRQSWQSSSSLFVPTHTPLTKRNSSVRQKRSILRSDDPVMLRYNRSEIVFIEDAMSVARILEIISAVIADPFFAVWASLASLLAVMKDIAIPLRIVDDIWTMRIVLSDESCEKLECVVSHSVLVELIGMTPQEAMEIRASKDKDRRREGTLRLKSVQESMERLDVVWDMELYSSVTSTPVIRKMQTLAQKLDLIK